MEHELNQKGTPGNEYGQCPDHFLSSVWCRWGKLAPAHNHHLPVAGYFVPGVEFLMVLPVMKARY
jgi:hypothetical protein